MDRSWWSRLNRRSAIGGGLASMVGLVWPRAATAGRGIIQRGIAGGGRIHLEHGAADFSLVASRVIIGGKEPGVVRGSVRWVEAATGLQMSSVKITDYQNLELPPKQGEGRRIRGIMRVSGHGEQPFVLDVVDAGAPGSGRDAVTLTVGTATQSGNDAAAAGSGFRYRADGRLVTGDVQAVDFTIAPGG